MATQIIKIRRGTKAELQARGALLDGELGFCTDTKEVYIGDGVENAFVGRVLSGTIEQRPNAGNLGRFFYVTSGEEVGYLFFDTGAGWEVVNRLDLSEMTGDLDDITDGATYGKVKKSELSSGQVNRISDGTNTVTASEARTHINDASKHRVINDSTTSTTSLWSSSKVSTEIYNAIRGLEWQDSVRSMTLKTPPASPSDGDRYIIPSGATGEWAGHEDKIAHRKGGTWEYYSPSEGWSTYVDDLDKNYVFNGTAWVRSGEANQTINAGAGLTGGGKGDTIDLAVGQGNGITVTADAVAVKAGKGISVDGNGVHANVDNVSLIHDPTNGNKLTIAIVDGGTF